MLRLQDLSVRGKRVLMRVDFNVPLDKEGKVADLSRIQASLPSIQWLVQNGARLILMSHLGRPDGEKKTKFSLAPCAKELSDLLQHPVIMADDCIGPEVTAQAASLKEGQILLLENLRFYPAEEKPELDPSFAKQLASLADLYVDDAFATAHRKHSSIWSVPLLLPGRSAAGFLLDKEVTFLQMLLSHPKLPFYALIGGAKVSTKLPVLKALVGKVQALFIGGAMAFTFFKAQNMAIGDSLYEPSLVDAAAEFLKLCHDHQIGLYLPSDVVITNKEQTQVRTVNIGSGIPLGWSGMDIGPHTIHTWNRQMISARTLFWNGPMGVFESPRFAIGTEQIARTLGTLSATTVVGGGDSLHALAQLGLSHTITHLSTGGGATLEYLEQGTLPGIEALTQSHP